MKPIKIFFSALTVIIIFVVAFHSCAIKKSITLATTTSVENSGLLSVLIPQFEKKYNCKVKVIACGSGQAIRLARDGNADVIWVHDPEAEEKLISDGIGRNRITIMFNNFVVIGPKTGRVADEIRTCKTIFDVFNKIANSKCYFVSRADNSGTHKKELSIWKKISDNTKIQKYLNSKYYLKSGTGMAQTLYISNEKNAYCLADKATYIVHKKNLNSVEILFEANPFLYNPYSVIPITIKKEAERKNLVDKFIEFIRSPKAKETIKNYGIAQFSQPLFYPLPPLP